MRRGYTLLELTLVTTIAGVILALAIPRLIHLRDSISVRSAASELGTAFSTARHEAIARRTAVVLQIDAATGNVEVLAGGLPIHRRAIGAAFGITLVTNRDSMV